MWFLKNKKRERRTNLRRSRIDARSSAGVFQRNRTITGSTSGRINDTEGTQSGLISPRTHTHRLADQRRKLMRIFLIVFLSAVTLWLLIINFTATPILSVNGSDLQQPLDTERYQDAVQSYLDSYPMNRLRFLLDENTLTSYVSRELSEVAEIEQIGSAGIGKTEFVVKMRSPVAGWKINNEQYYVDAYGIPFKKNYFQDPVVDIVDESGVPLETSNVIASHRLLSFVGQVVSASKLSGYTVIEAALPESTTRQLEVRLQDISYKIKLSIDRPAGEQIEDMSRVVRYLEERGMRPEYIDVRVSGKAFYR